MSAKAKCAGRLSGPGKTIRYSHLQAKCPRSPINLIGTKVTNTTNENEQIKRSFLDDLKGARGFTESSVRAHADAIWKWQEFSEHDDFRKFNKARAVQFVDWLANKPSNTPTGKLSVVSRDNYIRRVKKFFSWLSGQPGYKSKVLESEVEYLRLSNKDTKAARSGTTKQMPTFEQAKTIITSIKIENEIDRRDRALLSLALITGMRIDALISLRMKSYDEGEKKIDQNPGDGVRTKNSKRITTTFFHVGWEDPERHFVEWYEHLKSKGFGPDDPIFQATLNGFGETRFEGSKKSVGKDFWNGTGSARKVFERRCLDANVPYFHPHSFRHLVVSVMDKLTLSEEQKKAISLNLGHANVGTTFGSYGYGNMSNDDAIKIVQKLGAALGKEKDELTISKEERVVLEGILKRIL